MVLISLLYYSYYSWLYCIYLKHFTVIKTVDNGSILLPLVNAVWYGNAFSHICRGVLRNALYKSTIIIIIIIICLCVCLSVCNVLTSG